MEYVFETYGLFVLMMLLIYYCIHIYVQILGLYTLLRVYKTKYVYGCCCFVRACVYFLLLLILTMMTQYRIHFCLYIYRHIGLFFVLACLSLFRTRELRFYTMNELYIYYILCAQPIHTDAHCIHKYIPVLFDDVFNSLCCSIHIVVCICVLICKYA